MKTMNKTIIVAMIFSASLAHAGLSVARIFSDGAILQREVRVPIWGLADPAAEVTLSFGAQVVKTVAGEDGRWMLRLDPLKASAKGSSLTIRSESETLLIEDVLVGDVWLCGGQSNMQTTMSPFCGRTDADQQMDKPEKRYRGLSGSVIYAEVQKSDPLFRQFVVDDTPSPFEKSQTINSQPGWLKAVPGQTECFTQVGYFFGRELRRELEVPIGLIDCNHGGTVVEAWMPDAAFADVEGAQSYYEKEISKWRRNVDQWNEEQGTDLEKQKLDEKSAYNNHYIPGSLYRGMVEPLIPFAMKGVIYYQGESNRARRNETYRDSLTALIHHWRKNWGQEKLYFFWAQIANWKEPVNEPVEKDEWGWAEICYQQFEVLDRVSDSGMAVLNDIGHHRSIHPGNKVDVGKRLSRWALQAEGKDLVPSGPLYKSATKEGRKVTITFAHAGSGLMTGTKIDLEPTVETEEPLGHFQICGVDRQWKWAEAEISGIDTVDVWHSEILDPAEIRYAWAANPVAANLYNKEGLPASIFKVELQRTATE